MKLQRHSGVFSIVRLFEPNPQSPSVSSALTKYTNENENKGVKNNPKERAVRLCFSLESHLLQNLSFFLITMNGQKKATDNFLSSVKVSGSGSQQLSNATVEVDNNVFRSHRPTLSPFLQLLSETPPAQCGQELDAVLTNLQLQLLWKAGMLHPRSAKTIPFLKV